MHRTNTPSQKLKPLTPRQANALQMVLDGYTRNEVCEKIGITPKTLWNWKNLPAWNAQVDVVLKGATGDGQGQIKSMLPLATRRLGQLIHSQTETVALGACRTVLEAHANLVAREEQREVLQTLEAELDNLKAIAAGTQAAALGGSLEPPIDAEIEPIPHGDTHEEVIVMEEAQ